MTVTHFITYAVLWSYCIVGLRAEDPRPKVRFFSEEMTCDVSLIKAGVSAVGLFVELGNPSRDQSYRIEVEGHELVFEAIWWRESILKHWEDEENRPGARHLPWFEVEFGPGQRTSFFVPFAKLMTKPLPSPVVSDWNLQIAPQFSITKVKWKGSNGWEDRSSHFHLATGEGYFENLLLWQSTLDAAAWHYLYPLRNK